MTADRPVPTGFAERAPRGPFARLTGPFYERTGGAAAEEVRAFRVEERHTNALRIVHGGMMMSFLDSVLARAVAGAAAGSFVTLRMTTDFLAPARLGDWVEGRAIVTRRTRSLCYVRGEARVGERRIATADAVFRLLGRSHGPRGPRPQAEDPPADPAALETGA